jgi:hypothetical protein
MPDTSWFKRYGGGSVTGAQATTEEKKKYKSTTRDITGARIGVEEAARLRIDEEDIPVIRSPGRTTRRRRRVPGSNQSSSS